MKINEGEEEEEEKDEENINFKTNNENYKKRREEERSECAPLRVLESVCGRPRRVLHGDHECVCGVHAALREGEVRTRPHRHHEMRLRTHSTETEPAPRWTGVGMRG